MSIPEKKPPAFYCPACGQKHRADLSSIEGKPDAVLKAPCVGCKKPLAVSLAANGEVRCVLQQEGAAKGEPAAPAPPPKPAAGTKPTAETNPAAETKPAAAEKPVAEAKAAAGEKATPAPAQAPKSAPLPTSKAKPEAPVSAKSTAREKQRAEEKAGHEEREIRDAEFPVDAVVGRYRIEAAIGRGGTGTVYRAFDPTTNRSVALKVLLPEMSDAMRQRFQREIEVQANIRHPNIMPVFDRGSLPDGRPYFTMELLYKPFTLTEIVDRRERGTLNRYATMAHLGAMEKLATDVLVPVAEGLYVANVENGVIHRDLKPDNILLDSRTLRPYVIDFGICHVLESTGKISGGVVVSPTAEDAGIVGTPRFLAPEQARGSVGPRTDVWGLGALIHFSLTGEPPIAAATGITRSELRERIEALKQVRDAALKAEDDRKVALADEKLARLQDAGLRTLDDLFKDARDGRYQPLPASVPAPLAALVRKALAHEPGDRYVNVRQIASELTTWAEGGRVRALAEAGGAQAAADTAKRALKRGLAPVLLGLGGLVAGILIGGGAGTILQTSSAGTVEALQAEVGAFKRELDAARMEVDAVQGPEAARLQRLLWMRATSLAARIAAEPRSTSRDSLEEQLDYQRGRVQPQRVRLNAPSGYAWTANRQGPLGLEGLELKLGDENLLAPGDWSIVGRVAGAAGDEPAERVRLPLRLPFLVREEGLQADREAPAATLEVPLAPDLIPEGMVLVVGDRVLARRPPFAAASLVPVEVKTFLLDREEVTNSEYAAFLLSLSDAEAAQRAPTVGFVRDPSSGRMAAIRGSELLPVVSIRPADARAFAAWRSKRDGAKLRLPTETEWLVAGGAPAGFLLPGGRLATIADGVFHPALGDAGAHPSDLGPHGERGLLANAREMVEPVEGGVPANSVLVKGAGVGDAPSDAALYIVRHLAEDERHATTGFRLARDL